VDSSSCSKGVSVLDLCGSTMIAAVCWVPKGAAKAVPVVAPPPSEAELRALLESQASVLHGDHSDEDEEEEENQDLEMEEDEETETADDPVAVALAAAVAVGASVQGKKAASNSGIDGVVDGLAELDMEHYDEEDDEGVELFGNGGLGSAYYPSNADDPYLVNKDDEDDEEIEDMTLKSSDLIILTARNEDDVSHIEVWVYETEGGDASEETEEKNMYVHHDIMLPAFPLCLAWLDCSPKGDTMGNFVAVGTMQPDIEIWDLDVVDEVEPATVLGGALQPALQEEVSDELKSKTTTKKKKNNKKKSKEVKYKEGSHTDAVLGLSWNAEYRNVIASASADRTVKIWDIVKQSCEHTLQVHTDKVQAVAWNRKEAPVLLSGSFDRTVALMDMRAPTSAAIRWPVSADVESLAWDPFTSHSFLVSMEDGTVRGYDVRSGGSTMVSSSTAAPRTGNSTDGKPIFTIHAHEKAVCSLTYNPAAPNLIATSSTDKTVKLWDLTGNQPTCIASNNPKVGAIFSSSFCNDAPFLLALGGSKGNLHVWDTLTSAEVSRRFGKFSSSRPRTQPSKTKV